MAIDNWQKEIPILEGPELETKCKRQSDYQEEILDKKTVKQWISLFRTLQAIYGDSQKKYLKGIVKSNGSQIC